MFAVEHLTSITLLCTGCGNAVIGSPPYLHPASLPLTSAPLIPVCLPCRSEYAESLNSLLDSIRFQLTGETPIQGEETYIATISQTNGDTQNLTKTNRQQTRFALIEESKVLAIKAKGVLGLQLWDRVRAWEGGRRVWADYEDVARKGVASQGSLMSQSTLLHGCSHGCRLPQGLHEKRRHI